MIHHIFCDESRQNADRYMVIGGLIISQPDMGIVNATLQRFRDEEHMHAELKWTKVTNQKLDKYLRFVDFFFALNNTDRVHFHSVVIDNHQLNHHKFNQGDRELGFYKFYYQLLVNCFGKCYARDKNGENYFIVHPDKRHTSYPINRLRHILNAGMAKKHGIQHSPFLSIEPQDSKKSDLAQVNDIIVGAISFHKNGGHLIAGTREAKKRLAAHIAEQAGMSNLGDSTRFGWQRFKVWNFRLSK